MVCTLPCRGGQGDRNQEINLGENGVESVQEAVSPRWLEVGEMWKNCATLHNILQLKKGKEAGANTNGVDHS